MANDRNMICIFSVDVSVNEELLVTIMFTGASQNFWLNLIGFQLIWWLCVSLGNGALPVVVFLLLLHLVFHSDPVVESKVIFACGLLGYMIDYLLTAIGLFVFDGSSMVPPLWLLVLWLAFAATLRQSLNFFSQHYFLASFFGAIGGSSSYIGAEVLGVVSFGAPLVNMTVGMAILWCLLFPFLSWWSHQFRPMTSLKANGVG